MTELIIENNKVSKLLTTGASLTSQSWLSIDWKPVNKLVGRLQMRIAKAVRQGRYGKGRLYRGS